MADLSSEITPILRKNEEFLRNQVEVVYREAIDFVNDAIDYYIEFFKQFREIAISATLHYIFFILMPISYSIFTNLLLGNIPACFRELRFLVESLAKCYLADLKFSNIPIFDERIKEVEKGKKEHEIVEEFEEAIGIKDKRCLKLWGKLSKDVHIKGYVERFVERIEKFEDIPSYSIILPMEYSYDDIEDIEEVGKRIKELREILRITIEKFRNLNKE